MNIQKFNKWLFESQEKRLVYVLIGPPAVGKSSWIADNVDSNYIVVSKDKIIEDVIFPTYNLVNNDIFKQKVGSLKPGEEHPDPEKKKLGKVVSYRRFSRSKGIEVEELAFENAKAAGEELNLLYDAEMKKAISSNKNIVVDAMHMSRSTRKSTLEQFSADQFKIIGVVFPHQGYEKRIAASAEERAKKFLQDPRFEKKFDRSISKEDYEEIYASYEAPSKSEGFDELITYNRFEIEDKKPLDERLVAYTKKLLDEGKLSKYWKKRMETRTKNARREPKNSIDREWAENQQQKSKKINNTVHKIFEKELQTNEQFLEEVEDFIQKVKKKREDLKKKIHEKAKLIPLNKKRPQKKLPSMPTNSDVGKGKGVVGAYIAKSKKLGGTTLAPRETFGSMNENQSNQLFDSLSDVQKENFFKLIGDTEEYDILKQRQRTKTKNILKYFNLTLEDAVELVIKCPILEKPIVKLITAGTKGFIYLLDNDHILKLYQEDYTGGSDMYWYKSTKARLFSSNGNITDLPIYDEGEIKLNSGEIVNYVEMGRVIPVSDFMEMTRRSAEEAEADYEICKAVISTIESLYGSRFIKFTTKKFVDVFKHFIQKKDITTNSLTRTEFISLAKTIFLFAKSGNFLGDTHVGNIGVLPQSSPANPVFVIFDN